MIHNVLLFSVDSYKSSIKPKEKSSTILVRVSLWLAGERGGPSGAEAAIGFKATSTSMPPLNSADYTDITDGLYVHRASVSNGDWNVVQGVYLSSTSTVEYPHVHGVSTSSYATYSLLTKSQYGDSR